MSKVSAMQAMREARYAATARNRQAVPVQPASRPAPARPVPPDSGAGPADSGADAATAPGAAEAESAGLPAASSAPLVDDSSTEEALCGHRSMNNRSCRRPAGHAEKNHRYN